MEPTPFHMRMSLYFFPAPTRWGNQSFFHSLSVIPAFFHNSYLKYLFFYHCVYILTGADNRGDNSRHPALPGIYAFMGL